MQNAKDHLAGAYAGLTSDSSNPGLRMSGSGQSIRSLFERKTNNFLFSKPQPEDEFFSDPSRPLICAYNFPAVILTMGRARWKGRMREYYLELLQDPTYKIRHTLTASIGEIAKIIGQEHTKRDILDFWQQRLKDDEPQLRLLAIDQLDKMLPLMDEMDRDALLRQLPVIWRENFTGWRERLAVVERFRLLLEMTLPSNPVMLSLFRGALRDPVAAIRVTAVEQASCSVFLSY
jgi:serine/threonine-protein phosphatase 4 regulatory subunit 1